ncbi:PD-(D/E)XK nuclease domain-containing protein [Wolbachia endosymbiont of Delia radicum]|uniref:PD-(D/E)XK nuclease domain-containing protein n=1 Tax=Wolbachia endosymbiont of Delia radicum TaxID=502352 RepID=UPI001F488DD7|nr:PD-(D/E)XK nuclease domain-containing protein [Wolbachia endosymbiont of Delia radicum]UJQ21742.1 PD-(D/E)XK nuclease domain-containing protein [Wolbachia endosymbiont of Delia radicum]
MKRKRSVSKKQPSQNPPAQFDVPADGSCLFWATTLAHLIPVKDDEDDFKQRYMDLFGDREIEHISHVKELIQNYNPLLNEVPSDDILKDLVSNTFRNRVVNHIQFHEDKFRDFIFDKFSQYLNDMREPDTWGDQPEIRAMSEMLGAKVTVSGATQSEYGNGNIPIQLFHVSATGEGERNHYNFGLPQSVIDVYNDNVENLPGQQSSAKPKLIELLLTEPINSNSNRGGPVFPINREKPVGFAEKFSLFLDETPNIGSTSKPEFFIHAILGSVLTLPSSGLIEKLGIDKVYVKRTEVDGYKIINNKKVKVTSDVVKLCFSFKKDGKKQVALRVFANDKIKGYKNPEDEYRYSDGELEEIAGKLGISDIDVDEHVFRIRTEGEQGNKSFRLYKGQIDGVKEKFKAAASSPDRTDEFQEVSTDNAVDLGDSFKNLSSKEVGQVIDSTEKIFKELNDVYKNSEKEFSLSNSEAAYHGFVYGALVLNFKYRYGLNCYVERAAGNGRADLILMSRTKDANGRINPKPIPVVVEFKAKNHTASEAIKQIKDKGYLYNLSVRTRAKGAVIVGVNPAQSDALQVEQDEIFQSQNFLRQLLKEMGKFKMKNTLKGELKNLYHLIPSHDQHYLSKVIFGQVLAVEADELDKRIFIYEGEDKSIGEEATTFVLFNQNKAVILNIIEHTQKKTEVDPHGRTRSSQKQGNIFDNNRIPSIDKLGIDSAVKIDVKIRTGEALSSFEVEGDKNKSYYQDINVEEVSNINSRSKYQGKFREIGNINVGSLVTGLEKNPANSGLEYLLSSFKEVLFSHKKLIRKEKDFQAIVQGLLMNGEIKGGKEVRVYTESNISSKGRADLALSFMHFKDDGSFEEGCPIVIELKYAKGIKQVKKALISAKKQLEEKYNLIKSFTSKKTAKSLAMVFNEEAKNTEKLISSSIENFKVKHTTSEDGSSPALTVSSPDKKEEWYSLLPNFFSESVETEVNEEVATTSSRPKSYLNNTSVQGHLTQDRGLRNQGRDLIP